MNNPEDFVTDVRTRVEELDVSPFDLDEIFEIAGAFWERRYGRLMEHTCRRHRLSEPVSRFPFSLGRFSVKCAKCKASREAHNEFVALWFRRQEDWDDYYTG